MSSELASDPALVQEFLSEADELLQGLDEDMIALEASPHDAELLNRVFRALHTIKGTAGFLEFDSVVRLAHSAEELLNVLRKREIAITPRVTDVLLRARDQLGKMLADIREKKRQDYQLEPIVAELQQACQPVTRKLGDILLADGVVDAKTLNTALEQQAAAPEGQRRKLGDVLIEQGAASAEQISDALARQKQVGETSNTMRVDVRKLDDLVDLMGELVLERNRLLQVNQDVSENRLTAEQCRLSLSDATSRLSFITEELQAAGLRTRMVPIDAVFRKFPRLVRDVARTHGKEVELLIRGQETELDKNMVENVNDPLVHLVRNALDHGIELPDVRLAAGKPRQGTIRLEARQEGDQIQVTVSDDGAGIDVERVSRKAVEKGIVSEDQVRALSTQQILDFIFRPGFTTKDTVSELSGRGVGMDVVRSNLKKLNGTIEIENHPGQGVTVLLRVPLTLATLPVLLVQVGNETYALPLRSVVHTLRVDARDIHLVQRQEILRMEGGTLPLLRLRTLVAVPGSDSGGAQHAVILAAAERRFALIVDRLLGEESTVMKPLGSYLRQCGSVTGATISGDGRIRLVLNPAGLAGIAETRIAEQA
ncbi:MAG TPA: chemotaxis protein CheA [Terriglobales bacterium]|nr:chemotaxis protein CheA [Terriglobales bacterium]